MPDGHNIAMALRAAYWAMHRRADAMLARFAVTADQYVLLSLLAEEDGITQRQLVVRASSDANTVCAMLVRLERQGLVSRRADPSDGRARRVMLTPRGRRTHRRLWSSTADFRDLFAELLDPVAADRLIDTLARIADAMNAAGASGRQSVSRRPRGGGSAGSSVRAATR